MTDAILKNQTNKKALTAVCNEIKPFNNAIPIMAQNGSVEWISWEIMSSGDNIQIVKNAAYPTSLRDDQHEDANHLYNIKIQNDRLDNHLCITCGAIDTKTKADEFIQGIKIALQDRIPPPGPPKPLRIVLHQANSFTTDGPLMITQQHVFSRYIEENLRRALPPEFLARVNISLPENMPIIAHVNTAVNMASTIDKEESQSMLQNLDAMAAQAIWLISDLPEDILSRDFMRPAVKIVQELKDIRKNVLELKQQLAQAELKAKTDPKNFQLIIATTKQQLEINQNALKQLLQSLSASANSSFAILNKLDTPSPNALHAKTQLLLISLVLGKQTDFLQNFSQLILSRTTEIELHLILDMLTGAITEINCKSGLDRTGFLRCLWDALRQMLKTFIENNKKSMEEPQATIQAYQQLLDLVLHQDQYTEELDKLQMELVDEKHLQKNIASTLHDLDRADPLSEGIRALLVKKIEEKFSSKEPQKVPKLIHALEYQDLVAANYFQVAQIITLESTGGAGMKYGQDTGVLAPVSANPHPLKRLPMFVTTDQGQLLQLYTSAWTLLSDDNIWKGITGLANPWNSKVPHKHFITYAGIDLLLRNSQNRGA